VASGEQKQRVLPGMLKYPKAHGAHDGPWQYAEDE
jgi:hypothetical protein